MHELCSRFAGYGCRLRGMHCSEKELKKKVQQTAMPSFLIASDVPKLNPSPDNQDTDSAMLAAIGPLINSTTRRSHKNPTHLEVLTPQPDIWEKKLITLISISEAISMYLFHYFSFCSQTSEISNKKTPSCSNAFPVTGLRFPFVLE